MYRSPLIKCSEREITAIKIQSWMLQNIEQYFSSCHFQWKSSIEKVETPLEPERTSLNSGFVYEWTYVWQLWYCYASMERQDCLLSEFLEENQLHLLLFWCRLLLSMLINNMFKYRINSFMNFLNLSSHVTGFSQWFDWRVTISSEIPGFTHIYPGRNSK